VSGLPTRTDGPLPLFCRSNGLRLRGGWLDMDLRAFMWRTQVCMQCLVYTTATRFFLHSMLANYILHTVVPTHSTVYVLQHHVTTLSTWIICTQYSPHSSPSCDNDLYGTSISQHAASTVLYVYSKSNMLPSTSSTFLNVLCWQVSIYCEGCPGPGS
jgi:hypothetical protein